MNNISNESRLKLSSPFKMLADDLLKNLTNRRLIFMQNDGNYGDALIRYGTLKFFEDLKLEYTEFDMGLKREKLMCLLSGVLDHVLDKYLFVYSGNGAWSIATNSAYRNIQRQRKVTRNIFMLPATFEEFTINFDFPVYARDKFQSKHFVKDKPFCHDMAFYLALISPERVLPNRQPPSKEIGLILRTDNESRGYEMRNLPQNFDLSAEGIHRSNPQEFLRYIDQFEHVITDRLHVAIGAVLLGKKLTILAGSYFKIKAIYESSMAGIFDRVEFAENPPLHYSCAAPESCSPLLPEE